MTQHKKLRPRHLLAAALLSFAALDLHAYDQPWNGGKEDITRPSPEPEPDCPSGNCSCPNKPGNLTSPVYAADGSLVWQDTDIRFPSHTRIGLKRTYNSFDLRAGLFGRGWVTEQEVNIARTYKAVTEPNADGSPKNADEFTSVPVWLSAYGRRYTLQETATTCTTPEVLYFRFDKQSDGRFKQVYEDSQSYSYYSATGQLQESYSDQDGTTVYYAYDNDGRLISQTDSDGFALYFSYNGQGFVSTVRDQANREWIYSYSEVGTLTQVTNPDGYTKDYGYQTVDKIGYKYYLLTSVHDDIDDPVLSVSWADREIHSQHASKMRVANYTDSEGHRHDYSYAATTYNNRPAVRITKDTKQVGSNTTIERQTFIADAGNYRILSHVNNTDSLTITRKFDLKGNVLEENDERGNVTRYEYNDQGRRTKIIELAGSAEEKVTTISYWKNTDRVAIMNEYGILENRYTYDSYLRVLTETQVDVASEQQRVVSYTYHPDTTDSQGNTRLGQVATMDGSQPGAQDTTHYQYNEQGQITKITHPLGHTESYTYNSAGQRASETDRNGVMTTFAYNSRNQLISSSRNKRTVSYQYNAQSQLTSVTDELGRVTRFDYDEQNQPRRITYPSGDNLRFSYTYSSTDTEVRRDYYQADGTLISTQISCNAADSKLPIQNYLASTNAQVSSQQYNALDELTQTTRYGQFNGAAGSAIERYAYDKEGRLARIEDAGNGITTLSYDPLGRLLQVTDANNGQTQYRYNAWGELLQIISPDTGTTVYQVDSSGNISAQTNANGQQTYYRYDAQNRLTAIDYAGSDLDVVMNYDQGSFAKGLLSTVSDGSGSTQYQYDDHQLMTQASTTIAEAEFTTTYQYSHAEELTRITYPSGLYVDMAYDAAGRLSDMTLKQNSTETTLLNEITWHGAKIKSHQQGNGLTTVFNYDSAGRLIEKHFGSDDEKLKNQLDNQGQITQQNWMRNGGQAINAFQYDMQGRLTRDGSRGDSLDWLFSYDAVGNRLEQHASDDSERTDYSYEENSNRLSKIGTIAIQRDAAGNTLNDGQRQYQYNAMNRLARLINTDNGIEASYSYNYLGQRVRKILSGSRSDDIRYVYGQHGELLGEYDAEGNRVREYVYFSKDEILELIAKIEADGTIIYVHTDHLSTPRMATQSDGAVVWRWVSNAFGYSQASWGMDNLTTINHRFPGQFYDIESGLHYNFHRYYNPEGGSYITSDPIGLFGGFNTFVYVDSGPLHRTDETGLFWQIPVALCLRFTKACKAGIKCVKNPSKCRKKVCSKLNAAMHAVCDLPGSKCKGNDGCLTLRRKKLQHQTCIGMRKSVRLCYGSKNDPNKAGHNKAIADKKKAIGRCNRLIPKCCK